MPGREFPTPARLNERLPGLAPVLLPRSFHPFPLDGICTRFAPLRPLPARADSRSVPVALPRQEVHWIESPDYSPLQRLTYNVSRPRSDYSTKPPSNVANTSRRTTLYESASGGWLFPPPFVWVVAKLLRLMPSIRITSVERFYVTDNRGRRNDRTYSISRLGKLNQRFGNGVRR